MSIPTRLDHVVIAGPDLGELIAWFAERTGVTAAPGGAHPTGTANALVALTIDGRRGPQYLELIGPDPERSDRSLPATFDISSLEAPSVQAYAVHPDDIQATVDHARAHGYDPGEVGDLSRRTPAGELLEWRLTRGPAQRLDVPFLIDWGSTPHPGLADIPSIELVGFERTEPAPDALRSTVGALGLGDGVALIADGPAAGYRLVLRTESGETVEL